MGDRGMIDINIMINNEIMKERLLARSELAGEILHILGMPKTSTEYINRVAEVQERLCNVREEYHKFQSGIPF